MKCHRCESDTGMLARTELIDEGDQTIHRTVATCDSCDARHVLEQEVVSDPELDSSHCQNCYMETDILTRHDTPRDNQITTELWCHSCADASRAEQKQRENLHKEYAGELYQSYLDGEIDEGQLEDGIETIVEREGWERIDRVLSRVNKSDSTAFAERLAPASDSFVLSLLRAIIAFYTAPIITLCFLILGKTDRAATEAKSFLDVFEHLVSETTHAVERAMNSYGPAILAIGLISAVAYLAFLSLQMAPMSDAGLIYFIVFIAALVLLPRV